MSFAHQLATTTDELMKMEIFRPYLLICLSQIAMALTGGLSVISPPDQMIQDLLENNSSIKTGASRECNGNREYPVFVAVSYRSQVVAGTNYFIKVQVGNVNYIHIRVHKPLPHSNQDPSLVRCQCNKEMDDPLEFF